MLPPGAIIGWLGTKENIPAGFVRYTPADGRFIRGATSQLGLGGGSVNHTHRLSHAHNIANHTHSITTSNCRDASYSGGRAYGYISTDHSHSGQTGGVSGGGSSTTNMTFQNSDVLPPYYSLLFIRATRYCAIPVNGLIFRIDDRGGLTFHTASQNRFLRGADTDSNPTGAGGGGSHQHTDAGHTHNPSGHTHDGIRLNDQGGNGLDGTDGDALQMGWHNHNVNVTLGSTSAGELNASSGQTTWVDEAAFMPPWIGINHYQSTKTQLCRVGDIILFSLSQLPIGWIDCDGENGTPNLEQQTLVRNAQGSGGNASHSHSYTHSHSGSVSHTHSIPDNSYTEVTTGNNRHQTSGTGDWNNHVRAHRHQITSVGSANATYDSYTGQTTDAANNPPYVNLRFIWATKQALGGSGPLMEML